MNETIMDDDFINFVTYKMQNMSNVLEKDDTYKKYFNNYREITEKTCNTLDDNSKLVLKRLVNCFEVMSTYENALAYYLGMKQGFSFVRVPT